MKDNLIVSARPHIHSGDSIGKNMCGVLIALVPAFLVAVYAFRLDAVVVVLCSVLFCVGFEYLITSFTKNKELTIGDGSAIVTGTLLAFTLPADLPLWMLGIGTLAAIGVGKMAFGGLGRNVFNPALVGHATLLLAFPSEMGSRPLPVLLQTPDVVSGATVLESLRAMPGDAAAEGVACPGLMEMFLGFRGGSLGEVSVVALLLGLGYLLVRRVITWHIPVSVLVSVACFSGLLFVFDPSPVHNPLVQLFSGGLMLGAIFMATDYTTSPLTKRGMLIYGSGIGIATVCFRLWGPYPEGVAFAILMMNAFRPLIDRYVVPKRFGR